MHKLARIGVTNLRRSIMSTAVKRPQAELSAQSPPRTGPSQPRLKKAKKQKKYKAPPVDATGSEGVLRKNIADVFPDAPKNDMAGFFNRDRSVEWPLHGDATNLEIVTIGSNGVGIAFDKQRDRVVTVPYTLPGDVVSAYIFRTEEYYLEAELRGVVAASPQRDDSLVKCQYFAKCAGCQYQNTAYDNQLAIKRQVVVNAYRYFAPTIKLPEILPTVASPLQYEYRTKLTPHFDHPKGGKFLGPDFPIGFGQKGRKEVVDIEECVIGTDVVNRGIKEERQRIKTDWAQFKKGATMLLREGADKTLVTNPRATMRETVGKFIFEYKAGEFFQNNNSILPVVVKYVGENLKINGAAPEYLVDTYCGCGLFAITCANDAKRVLGVEISAQNVEFARSNAKLNDISNAEFIVGQAEHIFAKVDQHPDATSVVIDPPRKGCDEAFLNQLLDFGPAKIVYVSCNVHSQARDIEYFVKKSEGRYEVESLGGFDFFPQTYHVEGVAVLKRAN